MDEFFRTAMGRQFFERTMPGICTALERLAAVLDNEQLTIEVLGLLRDWAAVDASSNPTAISALQFRTRTLLKQLEPKK